MKKFLLIFLAAVLALSLIACGDDTPVCEHGDAGDDGICDFCGTKFGDCTHIDENADCKCDKCDEETLDCMTIAEARSAEIGDQVKINGVVARITYANGKVPVGFILVDKTSSIYVYDGEVAADVAIGNRVTLLGTKTYWVLDTEASNAEKFGYKGCNQIEDVTVLAKNEKTDNEFDKSWITESTVKEILETPVTQDITTLIYKVNAVVKKVPGTGFTNYYFFDLDYDAESKSGTGVYTYTMCNGADFDWLDEFDGKICTVYITALNAKSTTTDCYFRFLPVAVSYDGYTFDTSKAAEFAVKYYGVDQFLAEYSGDPALKLITNVSSALLGFENATLSYSSSNTSVVSFANETDGVVMHCNEAGTATVTVTATHGNNTYSEDVVITVKDAGEYEFVNVKTAIDAPVGEKVIVKGIVGPSLVNKSGFYLIDESGVIAVMGTETIFEGLAIGHEVILEGTRAISKNPEKSGNHVGQTYLKDSVILANNYGSHEYSTATFVTDKTLADVYGLDVSVDYSTTVYTLTATVTVEETAFYTNIYLTSGGTTLRLYCSSANQYGFLKAFAGQEVTVEVAACNWNDKSYYTGCVLSVITDDGKVYNELNFTN